MRRRIDGDPKPMFRGGELARLMTMVVMLGVIGMLMARAKDPTTWAIFAGTTQEQGVVADAEVPPPEYDEPAATTLKQNAESAQRSPTGDHSKEQKSPLSDSQPPLSAPENRLTELPALDEDSEEREALKEELQVIADKEYFQKVEMAAYYRLLQWVLSQPVDALKRKALKDPRFGDIFTRPDAFRGKLVDIQLRVRRVLPLNDLEKDNPAGVKKLWEIVGYNDSSGSNFFMCVTPDLPPNMPFGPKVVEDGRFVGYFLKLMAYEDVQGKNRAMPVLIGRFIWDPPVLQRTDPKQQEREVMWGLLAAAVIGLALFIRWGLRQLKPKPVRSTVTDIALREMRRRRSLESGTDEENVDIDAWLDQTKAEADPAINLPDLDDSDEDEGENRPF